MKNSVQSNIRGGLLAVVVGVGLVVGGSSVFAAESGTLDLQGTVATVNAIIVTPETDYNNLDLTAGAAWQLVATVNEMNNDPDGYTVNLESANAVDTQAWLSSDQTTPIHVNYNMKYGTAGTAEDDDVVLVAGVGLVSNPTAPTGSTGVDKKLTVTIAANAWPDAGVYTDTLTLTIASK